MRAAIDATPLGGPTGGIRRYTAELSRALTSAFPDDRFVLVSDQPFDAPSGVRWLAPGAFSRTGRWWSLGLPRTLVRLGSEVFHGTDFSVPYIPVRPAVMTVHDLSPWSAEPWRAAGGRVRVRTPILLRLGLATMVVTPAESVRREVIARFGMHPSRVAVVPHGASRAFRPAPPPVSRTRPYFLHVGTLEPRKNIELLVAAWRQSRRRAETDLVLAGRVREGYCTPPEEPGLVLLGETPERDLPGLYSGALACLCASHYEGFGLPVLEAMQCGAPVIAAPVPAVMEVAGDAALFARSVRDWPDALAKAATDPGWRAARRELSLARAALFSWERSAEQTREVYLEATRRFRS